MKIHNIKEMKKIKYELQLKEQQNNKLINEIKKQKILKNIVVNRDYLILVH